MRRILSIVGTAAFLAVGAMGQTGRPRVYLESKDEFANDFSAGVTRKNVPVILTLDRDQAGYVARFTWATNEGSKTRGVTMALMTGVYASGSYERVSMSVIDRKSKNLVYNYTCQKGGRHVQSVAECLAKHWKEALESGKIEMHEFSADDLGGIRDSDAETVSVRKTGDTVPAQITEHPAPSAPVPQLAGTTASDISQESVADAARRLRAEKAARAAQAAQPKP